MKIKIALSLLTIVFAGQAALADGIKLPGITIDENGIKAPGVEITDDGIKAPGVTIDDDGVSAPGVRVDSDGVVAAPGVRIEAGDAGYRERARIRDSRSPGRYDDQFFAADGTVSRDKFTGMDLRGYDFSGYILERVKFVDTDLEGADFRGAVLERVEFDNVNLEGADFSDTVLSRVDFEDARLGGACFIYATMERTEFDDSDLTDAIWIGVQASRTDFNNSDRGRMITRGPADCREYHGSLGGSASVQLASVERPAVTSAAAIEQTLSQGTDARVDLTVNFAYDSDRVEGEAHAQILEIAEALTAPGLADQRIRIEGHTDGDGEAGYNVDLSYRRAIAVVRMLTDQYDIPSGRLEVKGYGEDRPVATNDNDQGRALNRRVTLVNLGNV
ncbi:MAG: pentapeptide repeat-containing protein [Alphaproteobacteria bacterium]|nr:pentapeptide repeat-containing protein [Alphaproteobacteria bacterium]